MSKRKIRPGAKPGGAAKKPASNAKPKPSARPSALSKTLKAAAKISHVVLTREDVLARVLDVVGGANASRFTNLTVLRDGPVEGAGFTDAGVQGLAPAFNRVFADVGLRITINQLDSDITTIGDIGDLIWNALPPLSRVSELKPTKPWPRPRDKNDEH